MCSERCPPIDSPADGDAQPDVAPKRTGLPLTEIATILKADLEERKYILTGDMTTSIFSDSARFQDPNNAVDGLSRYRTALSLLFRPEESGLSDVAVNVNADAEITGIELDVLWAITPNLIASFSGGWLDTEIGEFWSVDTANPNATPQSVLATDPVRATDGVISVNGVNFIPGADATGNRDRCETLAPNPCYGYMQNQKGNQIAGSPEINYNIGLAWTLPLGSMDLTLSTNYYWQDEFYASNFNNISNKVDDWSMWNASARVSGERWYAEAWVKNIEDNDNVTGHYLTSSVSALFTNQFILDPQTYGVSVGYQF